MVAGAERKVMGPSNLQTFENAQVIPNTYKKISPQKNRQKNLNEIDRYISYLAGILRE